jgi:multicomponent K+:H+ antiporter subunit F
MSPLLNAVLGFCAVLLSASLLVCLVRLRLGPTVMDRILAFDTICVLIVGLMVVLSAYWSTALYLDLMLAFTLLGFFSTVAFCLYLYRSYEASHDQDAPAKATRRRKP